jgi:hypothetical protein
MIHCHITVKHLLAILLLFSMALPTTSWARVLEQLTRVQTTAVTQAGHAAPHCACCQFGSCACASKDEDLPTAPLPLLPQRSVSPGDLLFVVELTSLTLPMLPRSQTRLAPPQSAEIVNWLTQGVPLYRRHCAVQC